jgi:hypothetical protein
MFKKILIASTAAGFLIFQSCDQPQQGNTTTDLVRNSRTASGEEGVALPVMKFEVDTFKFGEVLDGERVSYSFKFTNVGTADLIINEAKGSCGCTVPEYPKKPIKPGESNAINVVFDSKGRTGEQYKSVAIIANTEPTTSYIHLKGFVKEKK